MEAPRRLWAQACGRLPVLLSSSGAPPAPLLCGSLGAEKGLAFQGTGSTSAQHPGSSAACHTQALPTLEKGHVALFTTGWSHGGRPADLGPRSAIWCHHCAHSGFLLRVGSKCCLPLYPFHDSALGAVPVPWMGREPSGPQGLRSLRRASLPLPAPSTICRDAAGGQIARLYGRGLHRAIPDCNPGRVGSKAWSWPQQGPVYRHICILSIKPLLLSCLAHDFAFHSMLEPRASAGLATDGHSRASNPRLHCGP